MEPYSDSGHGFPHLLRLHQQLGDYADCGAAHLHFHRLCGQDPAGCGEVKSSSKFSREKLFVVVIKYIAPIFIVAILVSSVLSGLGIITI